MASRTPDQNSNFVNTTQHTTSSFPPQLPPLDGSAETGLADVTPVPSSTEARLQSLGVQMRSGDTRTSSLDFLAVLKPAMLRGVSMETEEHPLPESQQPRPTTPVARSEDCLLLEQKCFEFSSEHSGNSENDVTLLKVAGSGDGAGSMTSMKLPHRQAGSTHEERSGGQNNNNSHSNDSSNNNGIVPESCDDPQGRPHEQSQHVDAHVQIENFLSNDFSTGAPRTDFDHERNPPDRFLPLPEGKKYHVFFSYCYRDRLWVRQTVDYLEKDQRLKCSYHERDFLPGRTIVGSITEHIEMSAKTAIVLTPDLLESEWCSYETEVVMHLSVDRRELLLVPVLLKTCDVPGVLRPLTYIDVRPEAGPWEDRLVSAITASVEVQSGLPLPVTRSAFFFNPNYYNLDKLCVLESTFTRRGDVFGTQHLPEELSNRGVSIPLEEHRAAVCLLDAVSYFSCSVLRDHIGPYVVQAICTDLCCEILLTVLFVTTLYLPFALPVYITLAIVLMFLPPICQLLLFFWSRSVRIRKLRMAMKEVNRIYFRHQVLAGVTVQMKCPKLFLKTLHLFYFNPDACKDHLAQFLRERRQTKGNSLNALGRARNQPQITFEQETADLDHRDETSATLEFQRETIEGGTDGSDGAFAAHHGVYQEARTEQQGDTIRTKPVSLWSSRSPPVMDTPRRDGNASVESAENDAPLIVFDDIQDSDPIQPMQYSGAAATNLKSPEAETRESLARTGQVTSEGARFAGGEEGLSTIDSNLSSRQSTEETCVLRIVDAADPEDSTTPNEEDDSETAPLIARASTASDRDCEEEEDADAQALELLLSFSQDYIEEVIRGTLVVEGPRRHTRQVACLCQYVEHHMLSMDRKTQASQGEA